MLYDHLAPPVLNIAHRGARSLAPENTLAAAAAALACGAHMWELDVETTRDGELVVIHDATLARTTDVARRARFAGRAPWRVGDFTLEEVRALDAGSWFEGRDPFGQVAAGRVTEADLAGYRKLQVPTLEEALRFVQRRGWLANVELKDHEGRPGHGELAARAVALVRRLDLVDQVLLSSFQHRYLTEAGQLLPELARGVLVEQVAPADPLALVRRLGAHAYHPDRSLVTPEEIARLRGEGVRVNLWTVNDEAEVGRWVAAGVSGLITDYPQRLHPLLARGGTPDDAPPTLPPPPRPAGA